MNGWHHGNAPVDTVVEVWYYTTVLLAVWDGAEWKTTSGETLHGVTHWRHKA